MNFKPSIYTFTAPIQGRDEYATPLAFEEAANQIDVDIMTMFESLMATGEFVRNQEGSLLQINVDLCKWDGMLAAFFGFKYCQDLTQYVYWVDQLCPMGWERLNTLEKWYQSIGIASSNGFPLSQQKFSKKKTGYSVSFKEDTPRRAYSNARLFAEEVVSICRAHVSEPAAPWLQWML